VATIDRNNGITVTLPDSLELEQPARSTTAAPGTAAASAARSIVDDEQAALLDALARQGLVHADQFAALPLAQAAPRLRAAQESGHAEAIGIQVDLAPNEQALVLSERDGYYAWHFPEDARPDAAASSTRGAAPQPVRQARFRIALHPLPAPAEMRRERGLVTDFLLEPVQTYVLKFVADAVLDHAMAQLESNVNQGLVLVGPERPDQWRRVATLRELVLPADRPARILLLVHGTFSSTAGSFGALGMTPWGQALLKSARENYDAVIGYDHPTLSQDPRQNATDLAQRLRVDGASAAHFDVICFSRGALVYRALAEYLIPDGDLKAQIGRVIFAAGTNGGTSMAKPDNWNALADLYTNLALAATRTLQLIAPAQPFSAVLGEIIKCLGALLKHMASAAISERRVPGLAAMEPDGEFIRKINQPQAGQPDPALADYYAITSSFKARLAGGGYEPKELPARLVLKLADGFADRLIGAHNDLVVDTDSMTFIDRKGGGGVRDVFDFGENSAVYHTNYFTRPETVNALARWLRLPAPAQPAAAATPGFFARSDVPATVDTDFSVLNAHDRVRDVIALVEKETPSYVVVNSRSENARFDYALPAEELLDRTSSHDPGDMIGRVLGLEQYWAVPSLPASRAAAPGAVNAVRMRGVVRDAGHVIGVMPGADDLPPSARLGDLAARIAAPQGAKDGILARRAMPNFSPMPAAPPAIEQATVCHFLAEMESEVLIDRRTTVTVAVAREAIERTAGLTGDEGASVATDPTRKITIQVIPRVNCNIVGDDSQEVDVPAAGNPRRLEFEIRPSHLGEGAIWVVARQGQVTLVTLSLATQVVEQRTGAARVARAEAAAPEAAPLQRPLNMLRIREQINGAQSSFHYELDMPELGARRYESPVFRRPREEYVDNLYRNIEDCWTTSERESTDFQMELQGFGAELFNELFPPELKRALWTRRKQIDSISVLSDEPFIPWELVLLTDPDQLGMPPDALFLGQMGLVRWLYDVAEAPRQLHMDTVRYVIPDYPERDALPATKEEKTFLEEQLHATPVEPQPSVVMDLLREPGGFDVLHFAGHGGADSGEIGDAKLLMQGSDEGVAHVDAYLRARVVRAYARLEGADGARPMIVLNACQVGQLGFNLTGMGGFSEAFLHAGAGAFVGTMWSVADGPAHAFTENLYKALQEEKTLAEAAKLAREAARSPKSPASWLAYAVYGHAHATVAKKA
jgi:N-acetylmuramoyl-L-alanine amidase